MNKTLFAIISAFTLLFISGCGEPLSSHHASIKVTLEPDGINGGEATIQRKNETDKYLSKLTAVIEESGLEPVTEENAPFNTIYFSNKESENILKFRDKQQSKKNTIPIEALIVIDANEYTTIQINLSEAYSVEPSECLKELYSKLNKAIEDINGQKQASLW